MAPRVSLSTERTDEIYVETQHNCELAYPEENPTASKYLSAHMEIITLHSQNLKKESYLYENIITN